MTEPREVLVAYRLARARETLDDARLLAVRKRWASCVNRLYYGSFYAVSALLLSRGLTSSKHTGIRSLFNRHFVKSGQVSKTLAKTYNDLFELRQEGDYVDLAQFDEAEIQPLLALAEQLVEKVEAIANSAIEKDEEESENDMDIVTQDVMHGVFAVTDELGVDRESITVPLEMAGEGRVRRLTNGRFEIALPALAELESFLAILPERLRAAGWTAPPEDAG